jgi:hypothetical protein
MFWGASILQARDNGLIRTKVAQMQEGGVEFSACIVCVEEYDAVESLEAIGITSSHTGEQLTHALKSDEWAVMTI